MSADKTCFQELKPEGYVSCEKETKSTWPAFAQIDFTPFA